MCDTEVADSFPPSSMWRSLTNLPTATRRYEKPEDFSVVTVPLPEMRDGDVLIKVKACGVCGTGKLHPLTMPT